MSIETRQTLEEIERSYMERSREALDTDKNKSAFYAAYAAGDNGDNHAGGAEL